MKHVNHLLVALAATAGLTLGLSACGGDDSGDEGDAQPTIVPAAAAGQYVQDVCAAAGRMYTAYQKSFAENREALGGMDPTDAYARTARQPFATLIGELERLTPPVEATPAHDETIRQAKDVLLALQQGDRQKLLALRGTPDTGTWKQVIDLAPDLKSRFGAASLQVESCQQLTKSGAGNPFQ